MFRFTFRIRGACAGNKSRLISGLALFCWRSQVRGTTLQQTNAGRAQRRHTVEIKRNGSHASAKGPAEYFTGTVRIDQPFQATEPARVSGATVTFEPGARTAWHTHPLGQTLIVTSGVGLTQREGGPIEEIRPGDIIWIPAGEKHWHGATPTTSVTHLAIQEKLDGRAVDWMEQVTDEQYSKAR
jgi:quercetin dioxygenase-like cupin family protein